MKARNHIKKLVAVGALATTSLVVGLGATQADAAFPGENGQYVWDSDRLSPANFEIFTKTPEGEVVNLTNDPAIDIDPAVSSDGKKIAFTRYEDGSYNLWVMNFDGSEQTRLTDDPTHERAATWSPDGAQLAFTTNRDGNDEIYVINADGSEPRRVTNNAAADGEAAWSPDGSLLAFVSNRLELEASESPKPPDSDIYVIPATATEGVTGAQASLVTSNTVNDGHPNWSPDGTRLVITRDVGSKFNSEIYTINPCGSAPLRLTNNAALDVTPQFSPDGKSILFARYVDGDFELHTMSAFGLDPKPVTDDTGQDMRGDWGPLPVESAQPAPAGGGDGTPAADPGQPASKNARGCTIIGTPGDDVLVGTPGRDVICALAGNDIIRGLGGNDVIKAGPGDDTVKAGAGNDIVLGQAGEDELNGQRGNDTVKAGPGDDELKGGPGRDKLLGQTGDDTFLAKRAGRDLLKGGKGFDEAKYDRAIDKIRSIEASL